MYQKVSIKESEEIHIPFRVFSIYIHIEIY